MSWLGLTHKGVEPLYPDEWNRVVDGLDILYGYVSGLHTQVDCLEAKVDQYYLEVKKELSDIEQAIRQYYLELSSQHEQIRSDLSTIESKIDSLTTQVSEIYDFTKPPTKLETYTLNVSVTPVPLSDVDKFVKRIHIKVPSWALYLVYLGDSTKQDFVLEPKEKEVLEIDNPKKVYVRSLGNVTIYVMLES
ncbi:MAG: hypothetical protein DRI26_01045 [Chloroflexi bacterium]|nr:MAG: hypothetical protein DRI26_01045 [Chloroflexota bacterium]